MNDLRFKNSQILRSNQSNMNQKFLFMNQSPKIVNKRHKVPVYQQMMHLVHKDPELV